MAERDPDAPVLIVKFQRFADQTERCTKLLELAGDESASVEPLFPGEEEPELGSLFQLTVDARTDLKGLLAALDREDEVEYAHEPATRRPQAD